jgi:hypothetical protein
MSSEIEVGDNLIRKPIRQVGARRSFKSGKNLFRCCNPSDVIPRLEHENFFPRPGKVSGGNQTVMAGADNNCIVVAHARRLLV